MKYLNQSHCQILLYQIQIYQVFHRDDLDKAQGFVEMYQGEWADLRSDYWKSQDCLHRNTDLLKKIIEKRNYE